LSVNAKCPKFDSIHQIGEGLEFIQRIKSQVMVNGQFGDPVMDCRSKEEKPRKKLVSLVVPCFNEEKGLQYFYDRLAGVLNEVPSFNFEVVCINDGSKDCTLARLYELAEKDHRFCVIDLARNFGKEAALTAGIDYAIGDAVIPIDADLQDPPELIPTLLAEWAKGFDVVLAKRSNRDSDGFLKRETAKWFYRIHNSISDVQIPENVGDFRLLDRKVIDALRRLPERRRFMKGLFSWLGFSTTTVEYARANRQAGSTKFSGWKLWNLALEGITSFSTTPLRLWTYLGIVTATVAFLYAVWIVTRTLVFGIDLPGYASIVTIILFLGGVNLVGIGVIGEYIGRIYLETKQRPIYIVRQVTRHPNNE
jgi:polyisoprenyl-phosphate glycosyltransferase